VICSGTRAAPWPGCPRAFTEGARAASGSEPGPERGPLLRDGLGLDPAAPTPGGAE